MAAPVLYPKAMLHTVTTRPMMKAFIPAPGGAFASSPSASTATARMAVAVNSLKKAVLGATHSYLGKVMKELTVPPFARSGPPNSRMSDWKRPKAMRAAMKAPRIWANT